MQPRIFIVEDSRTQAEHLRGTLEVACRDFVREGLEIEIFSTGGAFTRRLRRGDAHLSLIDLHLPDISGLELVAASVDAGVPAVVVTASESIESAVEAIKRGATDYITKPVVPARLGVVVRNALQMARQGGELRWHRAQLERRRGPERVLGSSPGMVKIRATLKRLAGRPIPALIIGETGTGKELAARALHCGGADPRAPFVDVNCAALTDSLISSELFGHERGAFTGAEGRRQGCFERAHGGALFLDEIGDMPLGAQARILRVLQEGQVYRVGGDRPTEVNARLICATNVDLQAAVEAGRFRKDLYYRISAVVIELPPLRERAEDIPIIADAFLASCRRRHQLPVRSISDAAIRRLLAHPWPGNVRELEHAIDRAALFCDGEEILPEHLPPSLRMPGAVAGPARARDLPGAVSELERRMILEALEAEGWVKARAARRLGVTGRVLSYKVEQFGIRRPDQPEVS